MSKVPEFKSFPDTITEYINKIHTNKNSEYCNNILNDIYEICNNNIDVDDIQNILNGKIKIRSFNFSNYILEIMLNKYHTYYNNLIKFLDIFQNNKINFDTYILFKCIKNIPLNDCHILIDNYFNIWYTNISYNSEYDNYFNNFNNNNSLYTHILQLYIRYFQKAYRSSNYGEIFYNNLLFILKYFSDNHLYIDYDDISELSYASCWYNITDCMIFIMENFNKNNIIYKVDTLIFTIQNFDDIYKISLDNFLNLKYSYLFKYVRHFNYNFKYINYLIDKCNYDNTDKFNFTKQLLNTTMNNNYNLNKIFTFINDICNLNNNQILEYLNIISKNIKYNFNGLSNILFKDFLQLITEPDLIIHSDLLINICRNTTEKVNCRHIAKSLLNFGINVNLQDKYGKTALHYAYQLNHTFIIKYILSYTGGMHFQTNPDVNILDIYNCKPIDYK